MLNWQGVIINGKNKEKPEKPALGLKDCSRSR